MAARRIIIKVQPNVALFEAVRQQSPFERLKCYLSANQITSLTAPTKSVQFRNSANPLRDYRKSCSSRVLFFFSRSDFRRSRFSRRRRSFCLSGFGSCFTISSRCARHFFVSFESFWPQPLRNVFRLPFISAEYFHVPPLRVSFLCKNLSLPSERFQLVFPSPVLYFMHHLDGNRNTLAKAATLYH